jgi:HAD superfamily hydrolase (TIGR01662 family)
MGRGETAKRRQSITHIYFDWSGTLAHKGSRETFIRSSTRRQKRGTLYREAMPTLKGLHARGYTMGVISNTSNSPTKFRTALRKAGLRNYLNGAIVTNTRRTCRKPCAAIFRRALADDHVRDPAKALMVGDKYSKDVVGARRVGMRSYHVTPRGRIHRLLDQL